MKPAYAIFHLNLAYSSVAVEQRRILIDCCYTPLLDLIEETGYPLGVELSGWSLNALQALAPEWVKRFRTLLVHGRCELIGSGYVQMIGPLVPAEVNIWNQQLGLEVYEAVLGIRPELALVNEMAFSEGLIAIYRQAGYQALVMDADNVRLAQGEGAVLPVNVCDQQGEQLPILWTDSILFQKFQRYVHGEISLEDYSAYLASRCETDNQPLCIYCNDAEVFGFRPGRFGTETPLHDENEWCRVRQLLEQVTSQGVQWKSPSVARQFRSVEVDHCRVTSAAFPVPVKKQPKYNLSRWAVTGRADLALNTACHQEFRRWQSGEVTARQARQLCERWASDWRTHIEARRWEDMVPHLASVSEAAEMPSMDAECNDLSGIEHRYTHDGMVLELRTEQIRLTLNLRRGLSIRALAFAAHDYVPLVGTQQHGYFHSIDLGADFFSGNLVAEYAEGPFRITDLDWVTPSLWQTDDGVWVSGTIDTAVATIRKTLFIPTEQPRVQVMITPIGLPRQRGRVRVAAATLLTQNLGSDCWYETVNGGLRAERFAFSEDFDQGQAVSPIVSCTTGLGATEGWVGFGDMQRAIKVSWDPAMAAVFPLLTYRKCRPSPFLRLSLSLLESDDTFVSGGKLPGVSYWVEAL